MLSNIKWPLLIIISLNYLSACDSSTAEKTVDNTISNTPDINASSDSNARWLAGSWGITHRLDGGYRLDSAVNSSDWVAGAQQIVENLPSAGHVITSFTHPAHAYLFTLRDNNNVNVSAKIHPDMVPSIQNEQVIFDVIDEYRRAGKKVIMYLNTAGPSMIRDTFPENELAIKAAWESYYNAKPWKGDEAAAWRDLVLGYVERLDGLVDGYWLDNVSELPGEVSDFVEMIRSVDPTLAIAINKGKDYFKDENNNFIYVDSDGVNDEDDTDYKIVQYKASNEYEDFTSGHVTPLGNGAPPNSFGYEEFTIPDVQNAPWDNYEGKDVLKHAWYPIRETWSTGTNLVFEIEQAYRFTRNYTDVGAGITWSTTEKNGYIRADEMEIMLEIEHRLSQNPKQDFIPYERPNGAYLLENN